MLPFHRWRKNQREIYSMFTQMGAAKISCGAEAVLLH